MSPSVDPASSAEFDPDAFKKWSPKAQEEALAILERLRKPVRIWYCQRGPTCDGHPHDNVPYEHARADQWPPVKRKQWLVWMLFGGRGCVAPWTRVWDESAGAWVRIDQMGETTVLAHDGLPAHTLDAPFLKGYAHQWEVVTEDGSTITVTDEHQFLTPEGWQRLDSLHVGSPLASARPSPLPTTSARLSESLAGARSSSRTPGGSQDGCPTYRHSDGRQLLPAGAVGPALAPSLADAGVRTLLAWPGGAQGRAGGCSRACPPSGHLSRSGSSPVEPSPLDAEYLVGPSHAWSTPPTFRWPGRFPSSSNPEPTSDASVRRRTRMSRGASRPALSGCRAGSRAEARPPRGAADAPSANSLRHAPRSLSGSTLLGTSSASLERPYPHPTGWTRIVSITYSHYGEFWDLQVPGPNSYVAEGLVHHNSGKTKAGAEYTRKSTDRIGRIALIGPTSADVRDTMIEGESGLIVACENAHMDYKWEPSKRRFTFQNGAIAQTFSAEEPDRLRGPQFGLGWLDEPAHYADPDEVWSMFMFGLRIGKHPHAVVTTTPLPNAWTKRMASDEDTVVSRVSTYDNAANLPASFLRQMKERYEGTRLGRQELHGEILMDVEGALWTWDMIDHARLREVDDPRAFARDLDRIVVSIDPAGTSTKRSDETGIIVMGKKGLDLYVLADYSGKYTPERWARKAVSAYDEWQADCIVAENNYGGEMVRATLANVSAFPRVKEVNSRRGKLIRAEPVVSLYEQARVHHVGPEGFAALETQQTEWIPGTGNSPDRVDALVHGAHELVDVTRPATIASALGRTLPRRMRRGASISVVQPRPQVRSWA